LVCESGCHTNSQGLQFEDICIECGFLGWAPGDGFVYPIPVLNGTRFSEGDYSDLSFLSQLIESPKRTRMNSLCSAWGVSNAGNLANRLEKLHNIVRPFGLDLVQLREGQNIPATHAEIVNDEPLILIPRGQQVTFLGCTSAESIDILENEPHEDIHFNQMSQDVDAIKMLLQGRDEQFRNAIASSGLKPKQMEAILQCLRTPRQLNILSLPTGFGKTRIAQVISWALRRQNEGATLMVSPLISLMDDQRFQFDVFDADLKSSIDLKLHPNVNQGYNSVFLTEFEERDSLDLMTELRNDNLDLVCCSPERLISSSQDLMWVETMCQLDKKISTLIIDEAHIVGDWGASIRPEFQMLSWVKDRLLMANPNLRVILMSATISIAEEEELKQLFSNDLHIADTLRVAETRKDLYFHIERHPEPLEESANTIVSRLHTERLRIPARWNEATITHKYHSPLLLYSPLKQSANEILKPIVGHTFGNVEMYTGDTPGSRRESIRTDFVNNQFPCLLATSAFGMGIDKPDIWTTGYIGMPHTLKGLYQAFGRAARRSNWSNPNPLLWKSGVCFASIPETWPQRYRSPLGLPKTFERLFDMFCSKNTTILENGHIVVPIREGLEGKFWLPPSKESLSFDDDDIGDDSLLWKEIMLFSEEDKVEAMRKLRSKDQLYKNRLWVLSCLQRSGAFTFEGMHTRILKEQTGTGSKKKLIDVLRESGYTGVVETLGGLDASWKFPNQMPQFAVLKANREINNWVELGDAVIEGYDLLKDRHSSGRVEIQQFLEDIRNGECIRKLFSPTIGLNVNEAQTCVELIDGADFCMPCSNCKLHYNEFGMNPDSFIWSDANTLHILGAHERVDNDPLVSISEITASENRKRKKKGLPSYPVIKNLDSIPFIEYDFSALQLNNRYHIYKISDFTLICTASFNDGELILDGDDSAVLEDIIITNWHSFLICRNTNRIVLI